MGQRMNGPCQTLGTGGVTVYFVAAELRHLDATTELFHIWAYLRPLYRVG